ncbi:MAG: response regulator transcription factor [Kordiimonadaceae bacterium]|nr:response regulator transcription factor [Kordiimonadaceae bacterium]
MPAAKAPEADGPSVLVVEDHRQTAETIQIYLDAAGYATTVQHDGQQALTLLQQQSFDLIILDILLPGIDGRTLLDWIRERMNTPIIMLTSLSSEAARIAGLNSGADDYMVKPFSPKELVARVKARLRNTLQASDFKDKNHILRCGPINLEPGKRQAFKNKSEITLTPSEFDLLVIFMSAPDRVFGRGDLVERVFGFNHEGSEKTISSHIFNLRRAIEIDPSEPRLLKTVFGVGYRFDANGEDNL